MDINDAIHSLETFGRHMGNGFISINHDRSCELLLKNAVICLEDVGMIERSNNALLSKHTVKIVNKKVEKVDYTTGL